MNNYRKPNGEYTEDFEEYAEAWEDLYKPVLEATNTLMHSYCPIVVLRSKDRYRDTVELPVWFLEALNQWIAEQISRSEA